MVLSDADPAADRWRGLGSRLQPAGWRYGARRAVSRAQRLPVASDLSPSLATAVTAVLILHALTHPSCSTHTAPPQPPAAATAAAAAAAAVGSRCHVVKGGHSFGCVRLNRHFSSGLSRRNQLSSGESSSSKKTKYWYLSHERVWLLLSYRILMMTPAYHSARDESILVGHV